MIPPHRRNVVLIGMMGSGKTTVGRHLARRLGRPFVDTDRIICNEQGRSIAELFSDCGEDHFRDLESAVIQRVAAVPNQIIAVGGGAVCRPVNVDALRATGDVVLLDASISQLARRVTSGRSADARPLVADADQALDRLKGLWNERQALYESAAAHRVDSGHRPPPVVAEEIAAWMTTRRTEPGPMTGTGPSGSDPTTAGLPPNPESER